MRLSRTMDGVRCLRMTNYSKFKTLSIVAGVISLIAGLNVVSGLAGIVFFAYYGRSIAKSMVAQGVILGPQALPHFTIGQMVVIVLSGPIAVSAFQWRSRLRRKMTLEQESVGSQIPNTL